MLFSLHFLCLFTFVHIMYSIEYPYGFGSGTFKFFPIK